MSRPVVVDSGYLNTAFGPDDGQNVNSLRLEARLWQPRQIAEPRAGLRQQPLLPFPLFLDPRVDCLCHLLVGFGTGNVAQFQLARVAYPVSI